MACSVPPYNGPTHNAPSHAPQVCVLPDVFSVFQRDQWARARAEVAAYDPHGVSRSYRRPRNDAGYDPLHLKVCTH